MRYVIFILMLLCSCQSFLQPKAIVNDSRFQNDKIKAKEDTSMMVCQIPIGAYTDMQKWRSYLLNNIVPDSLAADTIPPGCYTAIVQFVIDTDGKIKDVTIVKDPGYSLGKTAADVIARYKGRWYPEIYNGKATASYRSQPVTFAFEEEEEEECILPLPAGSIL